MEPYLLISYLNDFIFCPRSIYFHNLYGKIDEKFIHTKSQIEGRIAHQSIENQLYSNKKCILQNLEVYSEKYKICGKIDLFDMEKGILIERKKRIQKVYDGYIMQVYAQYFALKEMNYQIQSIQLRSMDTNQIYNIDLPEKNREKKKTFSKTLKRY